MNKEYNRIVAFLILFFLLIYSTRKDVKPTALDVADVKGKYMHFSLDDVQKTIQCLSEYNGGSIFQDSTLSILKEWHYKYGIVVSLYVQGDFRINSKYAKELISNSNWLKFGYHGDTDNERKTDMKKFYKQVMDSIGNSTVLDDCPRIHYFHADYTTCMTLKELGCKGFLTCDDWSWNSTNRGTNYYLTSEQNDLLERNNRLLDIENNLFFIKTDFRLEHIVQRWGTVENLIHFYSLDTIQNRELIIFGHEWNFKQFLEQADSIFSWGKINGYEFDYPANR